MITNNDNNSGWVGSQGDKNPDIDDSDIMDVGFLVSNNITTDFHLSDKVSQSVLEITVDSPAKIAWKRWLKNSGESLGIEEDAVQFIDQYTVKVVVPGYSKLLMFDTRTYDKRQSFFSTGGSRFSRDDFAAIVKMFGGKETNGKVSAGKEAVTFFRDILGLKGQGGVYWTSTSYDDRSAWCISLYNDEVNIFYSLRHNVGNIISP